MRRQIVTQVACNPAAFDGRLAQIGKLTDQCVDLLLLANHHQVQLLQKVLRVGGLDLQLGQPVFDFVYRPAHDIVPQAMGNLLACVMCVLDPKPDLKPKLKRQFREGILLP